MKESGSKRPAIETPKERDNTPEGEEMLPSVEDRLESYLDDLQKKGHVDERNAALRVLKYMKENPEASAEDILERKALKNIPDERIRSQMGIFVSEMRPGEAQENTPPTEEKREVVISEKKKEKKPEIKNSPEPGESFAQKEMRDYLESLDKEKKKGAADAIQKLFEFAYENPHLSMRELSESPVGKEVRSNRLLTEAVSLIKKRRAELEDQTQYMPTPEERMDSYEQNLIHQRFEASEPKKRNQEERIKKVEEKASTKLTSNEVEGLQAFEASGFGADESFENNIEEAIANPFIPSASTSKKPSRRTLKTFVDKKGVTRVKGWEEMTGAERREHYGDKYEVRERLAKLQEARAELALQERGLSFKDKKKLELARLGGDKKYGGKEGAAYIVAFEEYQKRRAEYVGSNVLIGAKEAKKFSEASAKEYLPKKGLWEKFHAGWQWFANKSIFGENLKRSGAERGGIIRGILRRQRSLRSVAGYGLLGLSVFAPVAVLANRVLAGLGASVTSYEWMKSYAEAKEGKELRFSEAEAKRMTLPEMDEVLNRFYAQARFAGKRSPEDPSFRLVYNEYRRKLKEGKETDMEARLASLDIMLSQREVELETKEKRRRWKAIIAGIASAAGINIVRQEVHEHGGAAMRAISESEFYQKTADTLRMGKDECIKFFKNTVVQWGGADEAFKALTHGGFRESGYDFEAPETDVPAPVLDSVSHAPIAVADAEDFVGDGMQMTPIDSGPISQETFAPPIEAVNAPEVTETIEKGGNVWRALMHMRDTGKITDAQFNEAWENTVYKTPGGNSIPIYNLDKVDPGTVLTFIEAKDGIPAHIEFGGNVAHIGDTNDLANAFRAAHKPLPDWLQEKLGIEESVEKGEIPSKVPPQTYAPEPGETYASAERAQHLAEGVRRGEFTAELRPDPYGGVDVIYDRQGRIIGLNERYPSGRRAQELMRVAERRYLRPDFADRGPYYETYWDRRRRIAEMRYAAYQISVFQERMRYHKGMDRVGYAIERAARIAESLQRAGAWNPRARFPRS